MSILRSEHPNPQFERSNWYNLNGEWQFEIDNTGSGKEKGFHNAGHKLSGKIYVPFCPESTLSGVNNTDFMLGVWYKRTVHIPIEKLSDKIILHFGAVDYKCSVFINGNTVGTHKGGYSSFELDVTKWIKAGDNEISVYAEDDTRDPLIPRGKQSESYASNGCCYTRTTGIWQTVWMEFKPFVNIEKVKFYPNTEKCSVMVEAVLQGAGKFTTTVLYKGKNVGAASAKSGGGRLMLDIRLCEKHLWEPGKGRLYDVILNYGEDSVKSYFGLRSIRLDDRKFLINEKSVFQRLVLDQGYYPNGIYTAPSDEALVNDILISMNMGFNGARLHQKVFEPRFLYHCDRLGYIVWGEYGNWGLDHTLKESIYSILPEWLEILERDFNHPAIIGWSPYNETWDIDGRHQYDEAVKLVYEVTKTVDPTRPCIDSSGHYHVKTDIFDVHDYEQNSEKFKAHYEKAMLKNTIDDPQGERQKYNGEPLFISEYGGILWSDHMDGWGYGSRPQTKEEFIERFKGLTDALLQNPAVFGLCYTQLTDVEQEQNGLYTYDRKAKFNPDMIKNILCKPAAIEHTSDDVSEKYA